MDLAAVLIAGLAIGSVYALMALAINVVYQARHVVNFAQGDLSMLAGMIAVSAAAAWQVPFVVGLVVAVVAVVSIALAIERFAIRPLDHDESSLAWILAIVAVAIIVSNAMILGFGTEARQFPSLVSSRPIDVGGLKIVPDQLTAIAGAALFMGFFHILQSRTLWGKAMRAAARDPQMAAMLGIPVRTCTIAAFALAGAMGAVAAFLVGPLTFINPQLGFALGIKGFAAAALGGLGSFRGALAGGLVLGAAEAVGGAYIAAGMKDSIALVALCVMLTFRPTGLFGEMRVTKV